MNIFLFLWLSVGFVYAVKADSGETLAEIENDWQRKVACIVCFPFFVTLLAMVRTIDYLWLLVGDIPKARKAISESWHGVKRGEA